MSKIKRSSRFYQKRLYPYQIQTLTPLQGEKWKDLPGLEGIYRISDFGRIKRMGKMMPDKNGRMKKFKSIIRKPSLEKIRNETVNDFIHYLRVSIINEGCKYRFGIARMVYFCFVKKFDLTNSRLVVIPKDCDGRNCMVENLELCDISKKQQRIFKRKRLKHNVVTTLQEYTSGQLKSSNPFSKQVSQYTLSGKKLTTFPSIKVAGIVSGISERGIVAVLKNRQLTSGGFGWAYGTKSKVDIEGLRSANKESRKRLIGQKVTQYDSSGDRIAQFFSITDAATATGIQASDISSAVNRRQFSAGGYIWKKGFGKEKLDLKGQLIGNDLRAKERCKRVKQYQKNGKYIQTFPSAKNAASCLGVSESYISMVARVGGIIREFKLKYV